MLGMLMACVPSFSPLSSIFCVPSLRTWIILDSKPAMKPSSRVTQRRTEPSPGITCSYFFGTLLTRSTPGRLHVQCMNIYGWTIGWSRSVTAWNALKSKFDFYLFRHGSPKCTDRDWGTGNMGPTNPLRASQAHWNAPNSPAVLPRGAGSKVPLRSVLLVMDARSGWRRSLLFMRLTWCNLHENHKT